MTTLKDLALVFLEHGDVACTVTMGHAADGPTTLSVQVAEDTLRTMELREGISRLHDIEQVRLLAQKYGADAATLLALIGGRA